MFVLEGRADWTVICCYKFSKDWRPLWEIHNLYHLVSVLINFRVEQQEETIGGKISPQRWQYPKSFSLWGHFLFPTRKAYKHIQT